MEELRSLIQNLCDVDKEWNNTIQNCIKKDIEPQNKDILKAFDDFYELCLRKIQNKS